MAATASLLADRPEQVRPLAAVLAEFSLAGFGACLRALPPDRRKAALRAVYIFLAAALPTHLLASARAVCATGTHPAAIQAALMNISYVAALGFALVWLAGNIRPTLFLRLPRPYLALLATAPLVVGYCWLGGYSPSLYRAVWMFVGCGLLLFFGRHLPLFDALFLALAVMTSQTAPAGGAPLRRRYSNQL